MLASLDTALSTLSSFTYQDGGWQFTRRGWVGSDNSTYFFQYGGQTKLYNMDVTVNYL